MDKDWDTLAFPTVEVFSSNMFRNGHHTGKWLKREEKISGVERGRKGKVAQSKTKQAEATEVMVTVQTGSARSWGSIDPTHGVVLKYTQLSEKSTPYMTGF